MKRRWIIFLICAVICAAGSAGFTWWYAHRSPFPSSIRQNATVPLYYPAYLPPKFSLNRDSFAQKRGVVLYSFTAPDGNKLHITIQKAPPHYNFEELYQSTLEQTKTINTALGAVHVGNLGDNTMANLIVNGTWIMVVYSQPNTNDDVLSVMKSLKRY